MCRQSSDSVAFFCLPSRPTRDSDTLGRRETAFTDSESLPPPLRVKKPLQSRKSLRCRSTDLGHGGGAEHGRSKSKSGMRVRRAPHASRPVAVSTATSGAPAVPQALAAAADLCRPWTRHSLQQPLRPCTVALTCSESLFTARQDIAISHSPWKRWRNFQRKERLVY